MVGTDLIRNSWFRAAAASCCAVLLMVGVTGCPPATVNPCSAADVCDDEDACTTDTCEAVDGEAVCTNTPRECEGDGVCDPATGECVNMCEDVDCDDSNACTVDACDPLTGDCSNTEVECPDGESCDPATGDCTLDDPCAGVDCDDMNPCTDDSCDQATGECVNELADCDDGDACTDDSCDNATGECVNEATDCDDGDACTEDSCDPAVGCVNAPIECGEGEACVDGECIADPCLDVDCDDNNACTDDSCDPATGDCINEDTSDCPDGQACDPDTGECVEDLCVDVECEDDGDACTIESCDPATGECSSDAVECDEGETCVDGVCGAACTSDDDCPDDGLFCTGTESCDTDAGACVSSGDPCGENETCSEDLNECQEDEVPTVNFTLGTDNLSGTSGNDTFSGPLLFNEPTGTNVPSVQTGDSANGGDGDDLLNAQYNFTAGGGTTVSATLTSIETINITDFGTTGATTMAGGNITGATTFNFQDSTNTNAFVVNNLPTLANLSVSRQAIGATLAFQSSASSGTSDEGTMTFNAMTAGTVTYTTGTTNGLETLNIVSNTNASTVADIAMNGTTLTTINVSGGANFTHTASLDANVTTLNASAATAATTFTQTNAGNFTYTGGAGNDVLILGATYGTTDILDGGAGTDTLGGTTAVIGGTTGNQINVSNMEKLRISDAHTTAINLSHWGGTVTEVILDVGSNGGTVTNAVTNFSLSCGVRAGTAPGAGTIGVTVSGSGTSDSVTWTLNDAEQAGTSTFTQAETLNLVSNLDLDGSAADTGTAGQNTLAALVLTDTAATERVVITGTEQLQVGAVTANQIDASGFTQPLIMTAACTIAGVTVNGGTGNDTLFGSGTTGTGNDIMDGGAGNDIINPLGGSDIVTGGTGADTFRQNLAGADGADRQTITDFDDTPTTGDVFNLNSGLATIDGTDNFATSASIQTHSTSGNLTVNAAAEVVVVRSGTVTDLTSANSLNGTNLLTAIGGTITVPNADEERLFAVADTSGNVGIYYGDAGAGDTGIVAAELTLVAVFQGTNVDIANLVFNNFSNGA